MAHDADVSPWDVTGEIDNRSRCRDGCVPADTSTQCIDGTLYTDCGAEACEGYCMDIGVCKCPCHEGKAT